MAVNNSSSCLIVEGAKPLVAAYSVFPVIAIASYTLSIAMIVRISAYRKFSHRLMLYLAIAGAIRTFGLWLQVLPVDIEQPDGNPVSVREGWDGLCVFSGFFSQYTAFLESFVIVWICLHIFAFVIFQKQFNHPKQEAFGVLAIVLVPLLMTWEPFIEESYGLTAFNCWIKDECQGGNPWHRLVIIFSVDLVPLCALRLVGVTLILAAIFSLCRNARRGLLKHKHWLAIREILPLIMYPSLYAVIGIGRIIIDAAGDGYNAVIDAATVCLYDVAAITVPLSLILQSGFRREFSRRRRHQQGDHVTPSSRTMATEQGSGDTDCSEHFAMEGDRTSILASTDARHKYSSTLHVNK